jgi:type III pantothenate kinase
VSRSGVSPERSADEYALFMEAAFERASRSGGKGQVDSVWISSVVPALTPRLCEAAKTAFGVEANIVGPGTRTGVKLRTDFPTEVGSDLVCSVAAARELLGCPCLVLSFGTVLAISAVDAGGDFVGAAFAPGMATAAESLRGSAAQIPEVRLLRPERAIGRSTVQSVQSGIFYGYGGLVSRLVERMSAELSPTGGGVRVVGTGAEEGRSLLAAEGLGVFIPDLVLEGLAIIAGRPPRV